MSTESLNPYNQLPEDSEIVERYKPTFLARGGDHLVYEVEGHPDVIFKASSFGIKDVLSKNADSGEPLDSITTEQETELRNGIAQKTAQARLLRNFFGNEHTINERRYLMQVPVSKEILDEIFKDDWKKRQPPAGSENLKEAWTTVVVQERVPEISDPEHLSFNFGGFLEQRGKIDKAEYDTLNNIFVRLNSQTASDGEVFFRTQDNPETHSLADFLAKVKEDQYLKKMAEDLVRKVISYANKTGNILALAGQDNVVFSKSDGEWNYLLVDALPIHDEPVYKTAKDALHRSVNGEVITNHEKNLLMKALNFVRTINGVAANLGITERLLFVEPEDEGKEIDFGKIIEIQK